MRPPATAMLLDLGFGAAASEGERVLDQQIGHGATSRGELPREVHAAPNRRADSDLGGDRLDLAQIGRQGQP